MKEITEYELGHNRNKMFIISKLRRYSSRCSLRSTWASLCYLVIVIAVVSFIQFSLYQRWRHRVVVDSDQDQLRLQSAGNYIYPANKPTNTSAFVGLTVANDTKKIALGKPNISEPRFTAKKKLYDEGKWDSSFVSTYHKHYTPVNCAAVIRGERQAINLAAKTLRENRRKIPIDHVVKNWTSDCDRYRSVRRYPTSPRSRDEAEFPIAYIIVTHSESSQLERLLRVVYQPQNVYCIHPDAKSCATFQSAVRSLAECLPNVFIASNPVKVNYAHSSRLQADVNCMSDLLLRPEPWKYVLNLCAQDLPLKTNLEIVQQLKAFQGHNDIPGVVAPDWFDQRTRVHHEFRNNMMIKMKDVTKPPPPQDFKFFFGNAYYAATRQFVHYVIHNQTAIDLLKYSEDTYSPDEHYWVTLQRIPGVPGGYTKSSWNSTVRFIHWKNTFKTPECVGKYVRNICIFGAGYLQHLAVAPQLFANKFYMSFDPIAIQCMEELLDYRSSNPDAIKDFVSGFPATHMFGL